MLSRFALSAIWAALVEAFTLTPRKLLLAQAFRLTGDPKVPD